MKKRTGMAILICVVAVSAHAADDHQAQRRKPFQEFCQAIHTDDNGDNPALVPAPDGKERTVSREGVAYLEKLRKGTPFGTVDFNLEGLRAGMGTRNEPHIEGVRLIRSMIGDIPCEWVLAPGADPDVRLLYIHGGGFVSGSGGFYLAQAAHISAPK